MLIVSDIQPFSVYNYWMKSAILPFLILIIFLAPFFKVRAEITPSFGGLSSYSVPCTCSGNVAVWFSPLFLGSIPAAGFIVYSPSSTFQYSNYNAGVPRVWHLGSYLPGVQACYIYVPVSWGVSCVPFPTLGLMSQVGTGLPGF